MKLVTVLNLTLGLAALVLPQSLWAQDIPSARAPSVIPAAISTSPDSYETRERIAAKAPEDTPSGYRVPRYVSLKYGQVNGRVGPSEFYPVAWRYSRRGLPVIIIAETENWRKVRDQSGDESWMHKRTLDGQRVAIALHDVTMRSKPRDSASGKAIAGKNSLLELEGCDDMGWCKVKAETGHHGYVELKSLWGAESL